MKRLMGVVAGLALAVGFSTMAAAADEPVKVDEPVKTECVRVIHKVVMEKVVKQVEVDEVAEVTKNCCCKAETKKVTKEIKVDVPTELQVMVPVEVIGSKCLGSDYQKTHVTCEATRRYNGKAIKVKTTCPGAI
ncbi:MAG: hypothetical protein HQL77_15355 [Magnetococcales bacterium]|nr:hypothetical protein [Magnetococcales bacterium]